MLWRDFSLIKWSCLPPAVAGSGELTVLVEGPSNVGVAYVSEMGGVYSCIYTPTQPGCYVINIRYAGEHVTGAPTVTVC